MKGIVSGNITEKLSSVLLCAAILFTLCGQTAWAVWDGSAKGGPSFATDTNGICVWTSVLHPLPAVQMADCDFLRNALKAQGFTHENGWTITFANNLNGTITIDEYYAWVTDQPTVTNRHGSTFGGVATGHIGGAVLDLNYDPGPGDPTGEDVHWLQAIFTNCPSDFGRTHGWFTGYDDYYEYLDNRPNPPGNPYHDFARPAGSDWFISIPWRECITCPTYCDWEAQVFLATGDLAAKRLTIYEDGVWWGFEFRCNPVPEPGSLSVLALGLAAMIIRRRR